MTSEEKPIKILKTTTLNPIRTIPLQTPWREVESTVPCGLRINWVSGDKDGEEFDLESGAGCGNPWSTFSYKGRYFCIDMREVISELVEFVDNTEEKGHNTDAQSDNHS